MTCSHSRHDHEAKKASGDHRRESRAAYTGSTRPSGTFGWSGGTFHQVKHPQMAPAISQGEFRDPHEVYHDDPYSFYSESDNYYDEPAPRRRSRTPPPPRQQAHAIGIRQASGEVNDVRTDANLKARLDLTYRINYNIPQPTIYPPNMHAPTMRPPNMYPQGYGPACMPQQGGPYPGYYTVQPSSPTGPAYPPQPYGHPSQTVYPRGGICRTHGANCRPPPGQFCTAGGPIWPPGTPVDGPSQESGPVVRYSSAVNDDQLSETGSEPSWLKPD